jgi:hypothetical protein
VSILGIIERIQSWYLSNCNGDWEHSYGIEISTLDNPGWKVIIDISDTCLENKLFKNIKVELNETNWVHCYVVDGKFKGYGGVENLEEILSIFFEWLNDNTPCNS